MYASYGDRAFVIQKVLGKVARLLHSKDVCLSSGDRRRDLNLSCYSHSVLSCLHQGATSFRHTAVRRVRHLSTAVKAR